MVKRKATSLIQRLIMINIVANLNDMKHILLLTAFIIQIFSANIFSQTTPDQIFNKGLENFYGGKFQDAIKFFDDYIKIAPNEYRGYNYKGLSHQAMKEYKRSIEDFTKVISLAPNSSDGYINRGNSYFFEKNFSSALIDFNDAIRVNPHEIEARLGKSRVYRQQRKFQDALKEVNLAEGIDPRNPRVYLNMAWIHLQLKDSAKVFVDIKTAFYNDSDIVFTNYRRDLFYVLMENYKNSLAIADQRVRENPNSCMAYFTRGVIYYVMNKYSLASEDIKKSIALNTYKDPMFDSIVNQILRSIKRNSTK